MAHQKGRGLEKAELHWDSLGEMLVELDYATLTEPEEFMASHGGAFVYCVVFFVLEGNFGSFLE